MSRRKKTKFKSIVSTIITIVLLLAVGYQWARTNGYIGQTKLDGLLDNDGGKTVGQVKTADPDFNATDYSDTAITFVTSTGQTVQIPQYDGTSYSYTVNNNTPYFTAQDLNSTKTWHTFSDLDKWGRVGVANAVVGPETLQTNARGSLAAYSPSGWQGCKASLGGGTNRGVTRCERSHLIANKLLGDVSDNENNLVTGTHDFNANKDSGMLHWEMQLINAAENGYHIRYRVTPVFDAKDGKIAGSVTPHGVLMEAESIEDHGKTIKMCEYVYNVEEGWVCDYVNGDWELIQR